MTKQERIRRKLVRAERLVREAYDLAGEVDSSLRRDLAGVVDDVARGGDHFTRYMNRLRDREETKARVARELEEFGRCTKCDTGVAANHGHCPVCGWTVGEWGPYAGRCQNQRCEKYNERVEGVRYSDKSEVTDGSQAA